MTRARRAFPPRWRFVLSPVAWITAWTVGMTGMVVIRWTVASGSPNPLRAVLFEVVVASLGPAAFLPWVGPKRLTGWYFATTQILYWLQNAHYLRSGQEEMFGLSVLTFPLLQWPGVVVVIVAHSLFVRRQHRRF